MSIIESFVPAGVVHIIFSQTVLTPFDLLPAEILLKIEREWVQNVAAILCQMGNLALPSLEHSQRKTKKRLAPK